MPDLAAYHELAALAARHNAVLVAVSKTKPRDDLRALYDAGCRDFGENYVQEMVDKRAELPDDIRWHFVGHLQRNKVKAIAPFVHLVHGVDSMRLLRELDKQGQRVGRIIDVLLQVDVTDEDTKHGFTPEALREEYGELSLHRLAWVRPNGIMGMASNTRDPARVASDFAKLRALYEEIGRDYYDRRPEWSTLSIGMTGDYYLALEAGSTMLRIGSKIFGERG